MKRNPIETVLGALVLVLAAMLIVFAYSTANVRPILGYEISADFLKVGGLERGSDVRMSGIPIGTVTSEDLDTKTFLARVTMTIVGNVKLPSDTEASIVSDGLLGSKYVNLVPGHASGQIAPGGKIAKTRDFQSLEDLVGQIIFLATQDPNKPADAGSQPSAPGAAVQPATATPADSNSAAPTAGLPDAPK
jgi:phospholipid/cholesterol/gamma-HCH transport system substrate-binding protein